MDPEQVEVTVDGGEVPLALPAPAAPRGSGARSDRTRKNHGPSKTCHRCGGAHAKTPEKEVWVCTRLDAKGRVCNTSYHVHDCRQFFQKAFDERPEEARLNPAGDGATRLCTKCEALCKCQANKVAPDQPEPLVLCSAYIQTQAHNRRKREAEGPPGEPVEGEAPDDVAAEGAPAEPTVRVAKPKAPRVCKPKAQQHPVVATPEEDQAVVAALLGQQEVDVAALQESVLQAAKDFQGHQHQVDRMRSLGAQLQLAHSQMASKLDMHMQQPDF